MEVCLIYYSGRCLDDDDDDDDDEDDDDDDDDDVCTMTEDDVRRREAAHTLRVPPTVYGCVSYIVLRAVPG